MNKLRLALFIIVTFVAQGAAAQGVRYDNVLLNQLGQPVSGATITVCASTGTGQPCTPVAAIFQNSALTTPQANPFTTDSNGGYGFWIAPGTYVLTITGSTIPTPATMTITPGCVPGASGCATSVNVNGSAVAGLNLNSTTPAADSGFTAATLKKDAGSNVIIETPNLTLPTTLSAAGVFTNSTTANNENLLTTLTGGGTCDPFAITQVGGGTTFTLTDAVSACVNLPTSGVTNAFTNVFGAYGINPNANNAGQFGWTGLVGYYSQIWCQGGSATNTKCWGANFSVSDQAAKPAVLYGNEYDYTVNNNTTNGAGTLYSLRGNGQAANDTLPAIWIQAPSGTGKWTSGLRIDDGATYGSATNPFAAIEVGQQASGNSQDSQSLYWLAHSGATAINVSARLLQDNFLIYQNTNGMNFALDNNGHTGTGFMESYGIALKATSALTQGTVVKYDTANASSVVICTTTDTRCSGVVAGSSVYCAAGGTHCDIVTTAGSRINVTLGTGTCAIGNFVTIDTTTNGRVKCTTTQPAAGAYLGDAITAQSTVGSLLDMITRFQ